MSPSDQSSGRDQRLLTIVETARRLVVSTATVRRLLAKGELRAVRIGRCVRITADSVAILAERSEGGANG